MLKLYASMFIIIYGLVGFSQTNGNIMVYSSFGKVELKNGNTTIQVKPYDQLSLQSILFFSKNSKLYFINSDQKMFVFSKPGKYPVSKIIASVKSSTGELSNAMSLITHHFIEKGKFYHGKTIFSTAGLVTRGSEPKLMLFPINNSVILNDYKINPIFNSTEIDTSDQLSIDLMVNDNLKHTFLYKPGASIQLPNHLRSSDKVFLRINHKNFTQSIGLVFATEKEKNTARKDLLELANNFKSTEELLFSKALYYESKGFYIDALNCYNKLLEEYKNNSTYNEQKNAFLNDVIIQ